MSLKTRNLVYSVGPPPRKVTPPPVRVPSPPSPTEGNLLRIQQTEMELHQQMMETERQRRMQQEEMDRQRRLEEER